MDNIYVGNGILDQIKPPEKYIIDVEFIYKNTDEKYWWILDIVFTDLPDLQERIKKFKEQYAKLSI